MKVQCLVAFIFVTLCSAVQYSSATNLENLRCLICKHVVNGVRKETSKVDPKKKIEVGGYKINAQGDSVRNVIPYALSEMQLSDAMETVCKGIDDYVRAIHKETGELVLLQLIVNGGMNPDMSKVDVIQDGDLNKSLKYYCDGVVEEYEESMVKMFQNKDDGIEEKLCVHEAKLCKASSQSHEDL